MTTQNIIRVSGLSAISLANKNDLTLSKFADPTEGAASGLSIEQARAIAHEDPGLIYCDVVCTGWHPSPGLVGYNVSDYFRGEEYLGADDDGIEPAFALADQEPDYSAYTVRVSTEPSYYGSDCASEDAERIAESLSALIQTEFPGITVETWADGARSSATSGPDADTVCEIDSWIAENWTAAL